MYNHRTCNLINTVDVFKFSQLYKKYYKEIYKENFIDNSESLKAIDRAMRDTNITAIVGIYKEDALIGFFDFRTENEYGIVDDFIYLRYMYLLPEHRTSMCISYIYELLALMSHMNDGMKLVGDTYITSPNDNNNYIADGVIISKTWVFEPTKSGFGKKLIDRGLKRFLRREELDNEGD